MPFYIIKRFAAVVVISLTFNACGGGGGGGGGGSSSGGTSTGATVTTATGQFVDTTVEGLNFRSGGQSGVTNATGQFTYEVVGTTPSDVTFSVGNVTMGTVSGGALITPLHFGANVTDLVVRNTTRFLMMLDQDGNPENGIVISPAVRAAAATWPSINFTSATFDSDVASILTSVSSADSRTASLPTNTVADTHLTTTIGCALGGGYQGSWSASYPQSGNANGPWYAVISPIGSYVTGNLVFPDQTLYTSTNGALVPKVVGNYSYSVAGADSFTGTVTPAGTVSIQFTDNFNPADVGTGQITANRVLVSLPAGTSGTIYRGIAMGQATSGGFLAAYSLAINGASVTGAGQRLSDNSTFTITGSVSGNTVTGNLSTGHTFTGTLSANGGRTLSATFTGSGITAGNFSACKAF